MADKFKYLAFISSSHKDQAWSDWLFRTLDRYHVLVHVRSEIGSTRPRTISSLGPSQMTSRLPIELKRIKEKCNDHENY